MLSVSRVSPRKSWREDAPPGRSEISTLASPMAVGRRRGDDVMKEAAMKEVAMKETQHSPSAAHPAAFDTGTALGKITQAIHAAQAPPGAPGQGGPPLSANQVLAALTLLRELRTE